MRPLHVAGVLVLVGLAATPAYPQVTGIQRTQTQAAVTSPGTGSSPSPSASAPASAPAAVTPLSLDSAIASALASNPTMQAAQAQVDRAEAGQVDARSAWLPSLSLDAGVMRYQLPMVVAPLHGIDLKHLPAFDNALAQGGVSLGWTLFDAARGARNGRARALAGAAQSSADAATLQLMSQVARAYLRVRATREVLDAHERQVTALAGERDRAAKVLDQGRTARVTLLRAEAALAQAQAERESARMDAGLAERDLARLMGVSAERVAGASIPALRLRGAAAGAPARADAVAGALARSPALAALQKQEEAARAGTAESRALWLPKLQLVGRLAQYASTDYSPTHEWQGGVQLSYPLFTGGARVAAGERADAELRAAGAALAQARLQLESGVDQALAAVEAAHARVVALERAVAQSEEVARIEKLSLDTGSGVQTDYLTAEAQLLGVRASLTEAHAAEAAARIELARVTGELSRDWLRTNLDASESER